jgi:hypothetical protein
MDISMIVMFHKSVLHLIEAPCVLSDLARSRGQNGKYILNNPRSFLQVSFDPIAASARQL